MSRNKRLACLAMLLALAFVLSFLERMIGFEIPVPGVKLGLANLAVLIAIYVLKIQDAAIVSLARILLDGFTFGNAYRMAYSLAGGILSFLCMVLLKKKKASVMSVSMAGGLMHNFGQILVAAAVLRTPGLFAYLPILIIAGLITGGINGVVGGIIMKSLQKVLRNIIN